MSADPDTLSFPITLRYDHRAVFTRDVFAPANDTLARLLTPREPGGRARALVIWDAGLERSLPGFAEKIRVWFATRSGEVSLEAPPVCVPGGEAVKNDFSQLQWCGPRSTPRSFAATRS
ncbi:MAG: hypothetical protein ACKPB0_13215 [Opitutaceae bacterium]